MYKLQTKGFLALATAALTATILCTLIRDSSQLPDQRRQYQNETCGTSHDLANNLETCTKPVMGIIEGSLDKWPKTLADTENLCRQIQGAERCLREESRRCAKGLQKTIISTVANSVQRARKRECTQDKHVAILRMVQCAEIHAKDNQRLVSDTLARMRITETQMTDLDKKTNGICCILKGMETELRDLFDKICPADTQTIVRLYRAVLDDVLELICRSAKCQGDIFKGYKTPKLSPADGKLFATAIRIVFSLDG